MYYYGMGIASKSSYLYVATKTDRKVTSGEVETTREAFENRLKRRVRKTATVALARRLLVIAYHLLRPSAPPPL